MKKLALGFALSAALTFLLVGIGTTPAVAGDVPFSFTIATPDGDDVSGTFELASQGNGSYLITNIVNGMDNGVPITLLSTDMFRMNDNLLNLNGTVSGMPPYFTANGFAFSETENGQVEDYDAFWSAADNRYEGCWSEGGCFPVENLKIPEPSSMWLVVPGVLGVLTSLRKWLLM